MSDIQHLLVATDGSPGSLKAATLAGDLARALEAQVTVLMVQSEDAVLPHAWGVGEYPMAKPYATMPVEEIRTEFEKHARENELPETAAAMGELASTPVLAFQWGHAATEICSYADDHGVDLIIIGSHGRSGLKRVLLGSVSHAVANSAHCPVTIVR